jgi:hypothetical protein
LLQNESERAFLVYTHIYTNKQQQHANILPHRLTLCAEGNFPHKTKEKDDGNSKARDFVSICTQQETHASIDKRETANRERETAARRSIALKCTIPIRTSGLTSTQNNPRSADKRAENKLGFAFPLCLVRAAYINFHFSLSHTHEAAA